MDIVMGHKGNIVVLLFFLAVAPVAAAVMIDLRLVTGNVTNPVYVTHAGDGSGRLFIVEQNGRIKVFDGTNLLAQPFLNITTQTLFSGEQGLLSMAFHPGYATNGHFYVYFTNTNGTSNVVARLTATPPSTNIVNASTLQTVLRIPHVNADNHNGGPLQFGPDGYLYIGTGDGGGGCDDSGAGNNAQNLGLLLGKMLRIDVNNFATNYTIPPGNPFVGVAGARPEIWAYGLRNPWRFSFDRLTGDLWIGDVGQDQREEVDMRPVSSTGGENYGWRLYEGFLTNTCNVAFSNVTSVLPVFDYDQTLGRCAVMGGYRYRGAKISPLVGTYLYADECGGQVYGATLNAGAWSSVLLTDTVFTVTSFGEDQAGELYLTRYATAGSIYQIVWKDTDTDGMPDDWENDNTLNPNSGADASQDIDGDGFTNLQEFLSSTNPHNAGSALRVTNIQRAGNDLTVNFTSASNRLYQVETTTNLVGGVWSLFTNNISGTGNILAVIEAGAVVGTNRFYRVRVMP